MSTQCYESFQTILATDVKEFKNALGDANWKQERCFFSVLTSLTKAKDHFSFAYPVSTRVPGHSSEFSLKNEQCWKAILMKEALPKFAKDE